MYLARRVPALMVALACCGSVASTGRADAGPQAPRVAPAAPPRAAAPGTPTPATSALGSASLGGRIVSSADGAPVARARVVLTAPVMPEPRVAISGGDGAYHFTHLPAAAYSISVMHSGYVQQELDGSRSAAVRGVTLSEGQQLTAVDFALAPAGVIAGRILDEDGQPFGGATLEALVSRREGTPGTLVSKASVRSDDRGEFRLTGLAAGQYYVSAFDPAFARAGDETGPVRYTPTYYPGVALAEESTRVSVAPGAEPTSRITFSLTLTRPARVSGTMTTEGRHQLISAAVIMAPVQGEGIAAAATHDVSIKPDGSFAFRNVAPGRYQIRARGATEPGGAFLGATFNIEVARRDITNISLVLVPGASVAGTVGVDAVRAPKPASLAGLRIRAPFVDGSSFGDGLTGDVVANGSYVVRGLVSGRHRIVIDGLKHPWVLKSVTYRGQDITDTGLEVDSGQRFDEVRVTITDVASEISGVVRDSSGRAVPDATVLIIPVSPEFRTRTGRRLAVLRTDAAGAYRVRGLPAGEYRAIASVELDETQAYARGVLVDFGDTGTPLSLLDREARILDLPLTSMGAVSAGRR
jgi:protocatechuate 3,4-dioxygenase beta subunit